MTWQKKSSEKKGKINSKRKTKNLSQISQNHDLYRRHASCASHEERLGGNRKTTYPPLTVYDGISGCVPGCQNIQDISLCKSLNVDFDGDEINCHISQNPMATAEVKELLTTPLQILSPKKICQ